MSDQTDTLEWKMVGEFSNIQTGMEEFREEVKRVREELDKFVVAQVQAGETAGVALEAGLDDLEQYAELTNEARSRTKILGDQVQTTGRVATKVLNDVEEEMEDVGDETDETTQKVSRLGKIGKFVFGSILGVTAVMAIRKVIDYMKEAIAAGEQWSKTLFQLEVSVRALQRRGVETTISAFREEVTRLKQLFPIFTVQELEQGIAEVALFTRELGFTEEQILKVNEASLILAQLTGRNVADASRMVAVALSSGYTEGLQRLGLAITKAQIEQRALEMGFEGSIQTMDTATKAAATYSLIMEQVGGLSKDAARFQETLAGRLQMSKTRFDELKNAIGAELLPTWVFFLDILSRGIDTLFKWSRLVGVIMVDAILTFAEVVAASLAVPFEFIKQITQGTIPSLEDFVKAINDTRDTIRDFATTIERGIVDPASKLEVNFGDLATGAKKAGRDLEETAEIIAEDVGESFEKIGSKIEDALEARFSKIKAENQKLQDDLANITQKGLDKQEDIWTDFYNKIDDIAQKETDKVVDAHRDLQFALQDLAVDTAQKIADAQREAREKEEEEERKLLDNLRKLREKFFFDLEEAIRNRDVRQALRLQRRFEMDKGNIISDAENRRKAAQRELENEIKDIRAAAKRKEAELKRENIRRIAEIRLQAERERAEANIWRERQERDLAESLERQREARQKKHEQELRDIDIQAKERIQKVIDGLRAEFDVTAQFMQEIVKLFAEVYGSGGLLSQIVQGFDPNFIGSAPTRKTSPTEVRRLIEPKPIIIPKIIAPKAIPLAEGGTFIADKPTLFLAGEGGQSEIVDVRPTNQGIPNLAADTTQRDSVIALSIMLDNNLIGEIVELSNRNVQVSIEQLARKR